MASHEPRLVCQGCGTEVPFEEPLPFRCANRKHGDEVDHLVSIEWHGQKPLTTVESDPNPFIAFRHSMYSYAWSMGQGLRDEDYIKALRNVDSMLETMSAPLFRFTPLKRSESLNVWFKDETGNVAGSHKARHLLGLAQHFDSVERSGKTKGVSIGTRQKPLAIASCGNAALAAAVIAHATGRILRVFIPTSAEAVVVDELKRLGAEIVPCERGDDSPPGDPCFHAFQAAVEAGAVPFTCQGSENGLTIDGGMTLGFELAQQLTEANVQLDHLFLQVGGGALGSSTCQALRRTQAEGASLPAIHAVQTRGCQPLVRAWRQLASDLKDKLPGGTQVHLQEDQRLARWLHEHYDGDIAETIFLDAKHNRSRYMRPVDRPLSSIADGILDDETYDWFVLCRAMIETGGWPVVVAEDDLRWARAAASAANDRPVSATGAAGLAGVRAARRAGHLSVDASIGVLFTGIER